MFSDWECTDQRWGLGKGSIWILLDTCSGIRSNLSGNCTELQLLFPWPHRRMSQLWGRGRRGRFRYLSLRHIRSVMLFSSFHFSLGMIQSISHMLFLFDFYNNFLTSLWCKFCRKPQISGFDPCSDNYVYTYLNTPEVQKALHAFVNGTWEDCKYYTWPLFSHFFGHKLRTIFMIRIRHFGMCSFYINGNWQDWAPTILPTINELMASGIRVWIYR